MTDSSGVERQGERSRGNLRPDVVTFDSLPYFDEEIERDGVRERVQGLLDLEMKKGGGVTSIGDTRQPRKVKLFTGRPDLLDQLERIGGSGQGTNAIDRSRYQLATPPDDADPTEWESALRNGEAQLMHSDYRCTNIELLQKYGASDWRLHNFQQEAMLRTLSTARDDVKADVQNTNRKRKAEQLVAGEELTRLKRRWAELLNRCLSVELANVVARDEIERNREELALLQARFEKANAEP